MRVLVIGGAGAVGRHVCREVVRVLGSSALVVGDYREDRGHAVATDMGPGAASARVDLRDPASIAAACAAVGGVVIAAAQERPVVQEVCTGRGIPSVDIVPQSVARADASLGIAGIVGAGFVPGLSGVLAAELARSRRDRPVDVALLQSADGTAGPVGTADMLRLFTLPVSVGGRQRRGFSVRRTVAFPAPFGRHSVRRVAFPEAADLASRLSIDARYWTAFDRSSMNTGIGALNALRILPRLVAGTTVHPLIRRIAERKLAGAPRDERVALLAQVGGAADGEAEIAVVGPSDYTLTAMVAVALLRLAADQGLPGERVVRPYEWTTLDALVAMIDAPDLLVSRRG